MILWRDRRGSGVPSFEFNVFNMLHPHAATGEFGRRVLSIFGHFDVLERGLLFISQLLAKTGNDRCIEASHAVKSWPRR